MQISRRRAFTEQQRRTFGRDDRGLAAMEFAFIAPLLVLIFFGVIEGSDALSASRRASLAVNTLADLAAQETELTNDDIADLFAGVEDIIDQRPIVAEFRLLSVYYDAVQDKVLVGWSRDSKNGTPYAVDSEYTDLPDDTLLDDTSSLIVAELTYNYSSKLTDYIIDSVDFNKQATRWPRRTFSVTYCGASC